MNRHRIILVFLMTLLMQYRNHMVSCVITDLQLVGGPSSNKGTVEIRQDGGDWETTCGINLDINDVIVICRQLGFTGASLAKTNTPYGQNSIPDIGLNCNGSEGDLSACPTSPTSGCSSAGSASCHGDGYLGCFMDTRNDRVLSGESMLNISSMSISYCIQFCQESTTANYTYAGVESGNECYCGKASDNYTRHRVGVDANCSFPCYGDPTESCGGIGYIAVFTTAMTTTPTLPTTVLATSPLSTTSIVTSTNQVPTTSNGDRFSSSSPTPQPSTLSSSPSSSPSSSSSSSPPTPSSSSLLSSSVESQGTPNLHTAGNSTGLYAGIGGGVAAVVIVLIVIVAIVCFRKRRSHQRTKGIVSSQRATLSPASRPPAYDEIYDFGIPNGAMADSSSARGFQPGSQAHSSAKSRGHNKVLLVNLNPKKSSNIYEGTMDETSDDEPTRNPSRGTTAVPQNRTDRLSVHYAMPDKNGNEAQDGYDEINLGIAPYSSFENPKKPTAPAKMADRMSVVYAAPDKNGGRNVTSDDLDSLYAMPDKNGNRNPSDDSSEDVGSLYAMPDKSRGKPDGYDGDQDLYAIANDSFSGDQLDEMEMVDNELYTM